MSNIIYQSITYPYYTTLHVYIAIGGVQKVSKVKTFKFLLTGFKLRTKNDYVYKLSKFAGEY